MKRIILLLMHALMAVLITTAYANEGNSPATPGKTPAIRFTYQVYGELPKRKPAYEEQHFLGTEISEKWNTFNESYTHTFSNSTGFSGNTVEVSKPSVYKAVLKVNKYFKNALKKGSITKEEACLQMSHVLDCANIICTEENTSDFEQALSSAKTPEEIITLFESVELKFM